jgi:hypothetical protein
MPKYRQFIIFKKITKVKCIATLLNNNNNINSMLPKKIHIFGINISYQSITNVVKQI